MSKALDELAAIFKAERMSLHLTQKELADEFNVSSIYISYIENKKRVPSRKILKKLYQLKGSSIPHDVIELLESIKSEPEFLGNHATVYELKAKGLYKIQTLHKLIKQNPQSFIYIMALFRLYKEKGEEDKSKKLLLEYQEQMASLYNQKWLEAYLYQVNVNEESYLKALTLMEEALTAFEQEFPQLDAESRRLKSELLFRFATVHFDFALYLFYHSNLEEPQSIDRIQEQFKAALKKHQILRQYYLYPYSQLDYANIFYWLATLRFYAKKQTEHTSSEQIEFFENFIAESKNAIWFDYTESLKYFPNDSEYNFYPIEYKINNLSFLALTHARLAQLKSEQQEVRFHLQEGELEMARNTALSLRNDLVKYRYYYNFAHFYCLKAECLNRYLIDLKSEEINKALILCEQALALAAQLSPTQFLREIELPSEFSFYKQMRSDALKRLKRGYTCKNI